MSGQPGDVLSATHRHELETGSHILPDVIVERGYVTATGRDDLPDAFAGYQRRSGLVIPIRDIMGDVIAFQLKADDPRLSKNGRHLKYDAATGGRQCLDVPTRSRIHLGNPRIPLWITEGAKKVDSGLSHGIRAIIGINGTFGWRGKNDQGGTVALPDWESIALKGRDVVLAFDSDVTTKASVRGALDRLSAFLTQRGARVRYCLLPGLADGGKCGLDDFFASGHGRDDLTPLIVDHLPMGVDDWEVALSDRERRKPPTLHPAALHGLAGDVVRIAANSTEGDPVGILAAFLVAIGNAIGPNPYHSVGDDQHGTTLFTVLVGDSAKDRKGHSRATVMRLMRHADPEWSTRVVKGLSTGEGLIHAVRDAETRAGKDGATEIVDDGVTDKRLFVVEPEFARVLAVKERHGNTLSPVVRDAWDRGEVLSALTKTPYKASGSHISILGNITESDLHAHLGGVDIQNGLANRILWLVVRRARVAARLPKMSSRDFDDLTHRIRRVLTFARRAGEVDFSQEAWPLWEKAYAGFAIRSSGLVESLTARGDPITLRLALLFALLDESDVIEPVHLAAALAVWKYASDSVTYIFGTMTGNLIADRVLAQLDGGVVLTQTEVSAALGTHVSAAAMAAAMRILTSTGRVIEERQRPVGGVGRSTTRYRLATSP